MADGRGYSFVVEEIGWVKKDGEPGLIELQSARETDIYGTGKVSTTRVPVGGMIQRVIKDPDQP
ncbi:hypothetical protein [Mycobacterium sp. URHB0021]